MGQQADSYGPLVFAGAPSVLAPRPLPGHRILMAVVRNDGDDPLDLRASEVELADADGGLIRATTAFDAHGATADLVRAKRALVGPGQVVPMVMTWRRAEGEPEATRVLFPGGALALADQPAAAPA